MKKIVIAIFLGIFIEVLGAPHHSVAAMENLRDSQGEVVTIDETSLYLI